MKKIIIIIAIGLIVIALGVLAGLYMIGDKIIDETIDMSIPTISTESAVAANETVAASEIAQVEQSTTDASINIASTSSAITTDNDNSTSIDSKTVKTKQPTISVEKMNKIKEEVTAQDKVSAAAMVMSKLSSDDVNLLKGMLAGGLTAEEKAKAKSIAYANFSNKEIGEIKEMYTKYMKK